MMKPRENTLCVCVSDAGKKSDNYEHHQCLRLHASERELVM